MRFLTRRISVLDTLYASNTYIFKNFVFLLYMQALRHSGCWGDNSIPIVLLNDNENSTFTGIK